MPTPEEAHAEALAHLTFCDKQVESAHAAHEYAKALEEGSRMSWGQALNLRADAEKALESAEAWLVLNAREKANA